LHKLFIWQIVNDSVWSWRRWSYPGSRRLWRISCHGWQYGL